MGQSSARPRPCLGRRPRRVRDLSERRARPLAGDRSGLSRRPDQPVRPRGAARAAGARPAGCRGHPQLARPDAHPGLRPVDPLAACLGGAHASAATRTGVGSCRPTWRRASRSPGGAARCRTSCRRPPLSRPLPTSTPPRQCLRSAAAGRPRIRCRGGGGPRSAHRRAALRVGHARLGALRPGSGRHRRRPPAAARHRQGRP